MFDRLLNLSLRRSAAGIYYELRTLRQMLEIIFKDQGYELPREARPSRRPPVEGVDEVDVDPMSEEQLAEREADRIRRERLMGRDPGTTWQEDPNR
jgi:hypothetical protein